MEKLTKITEQIETVLDDMQAIIENFDTGSREDPLQDISDEVNKLIELNEKLKTLQEDN